MDTKNSVLIVDDDKSNLMELAHILRSDYKIRVAKCGATALDNIREYLPDLILLDVIMPDMNGIEMLAELKKSEATKSIPVIFLTGKEECDDEIKGLSEGAVDFIRKPFVAAIVRLRVEKQMGIINSMRDLESALAAAKSSSESKPIDPEIINHELFKQVNAIIGITEKLKSGGALTEEVAEGLGEISASCETLLGVLGKC